MKNWLELSGHNDEHASLKLLNSKFAVFEINNGATKEHKSQN